MSNMFQTTPVAYREDDADNGFAWDVRYDLAFENLEFRVELRVKLTGDDPAGEEVFWEQRINEIWDGQAVFFDGARVYALKINVEFVTSGQHQTVNVVDGVGRGSMTEWYTDYSPVATDEMTAHEVGHMLGAFDEYSGGATLDGYTTNLSLMSDLYVQLYPHYFAGIEENAEILCGDSLTTIIAINGDDDANIIEGTSGQDGLYGRKGADTLKGLAASDYLMGNLGADILKGGKGRDILDGGRQSDRLTGGPGKDHFLCDSSPVEGDTDIITDFQTGEDKILVDINILYYGTSELSPSSFRLGTEATGTLDRIIFDAATGKLYWDEDGADGVDQVLIATLQNIGSNIAASDIEFF